MLLIFLIFRGYLSSVVLGLSQVTEEIEKILLALACHLGGDVLLLPVVEDLNPIVHIIYRLAHRSGVLE